MYRCVIEGCGLHALPRKYEYTPEEGFKEVMQFLPKPDAVPWGVCPLHADTKVHVDHVEKKADTAINKVVELWRKLP